MTVKATEIRFRKRMDTPKEYIDFLKVAIPLNAAYVTSSSIIPAEGVALADLSLTGTKGDYSAGPEPLKYRIKGTIKRDNKSEPGVTIMTFMASRPIAEAEDYA